MKIVISPGMTVRNSLPDSPEEYQRRQAECGLKVGDRVVVIDSAKSFSGGWDNTWVEDMENNVGSINWVRGINRDALGILLSDGLSYPFFVLQKVGA